MTLRAPENQADWEAYYKLRWLVLRAPWKQPEGTERDLSDADDTTFHVMALEKNDNCLGVARLHLINSEQAQIRYMAVMPQTRNKGVGTQLLHYLEDLATTKGVRSIILQARENAIPFYLKNGYQIVEKSFILFSEIQHYLMRKEL